ncbi:MAG: hypothetical protein IKE56_02155 [Lachnospiraceae bacterium]|nr:hypothetical protein [Lachnospiraceae bacterium]
MLIGGMDLYHILWFFIIYAFLGWCVEVAYHALTLGEVINRGFLNGPVCPIYGFGMLAILAVFNTISENPADNNALALFFGGMALTTSIELFGGWALDRLFHLRWWDYSEEPFNFHGYICLRFSIFWGLGTVFIYRILHPTVEALTVSLFPLVLGWAILLLSYAVASVDLFVSVATVRGLNRDLAELDDLRRRIRAVSDTMSREIGQGTIRTAAVIEEGREKAEEAIEDGREQVSMITSEMKIKAKESRMELEEKGMRKKEALKARYEELHEEKLRAAEADADELERSFAEMRKHRDELAAKYEAVRAGLYKHPYFGPGRLVKAFPTASHHDHDELLKEYRRKLKEKKKR